MLWNHQISRLISHNIKEADVKKLNVAHSQFPQQIGGLMICGYEWGYSKADQSKDAEGIEQTMDLDAGCTFANKDKCFGDRALAWPYDATIIKWFDLWGHPLNRKEPGDFEKSIIQTNWCDSEGNSMDGDYSKLSNSVHVNNFMSHISHFKPKVILFMGAKLVDALNSPAIFEQFEAICGKCVNPLKSLQKDFSGRRFRVAFQSFDACEVICLPHPSGSHGLSDSYIELFEEEMNTILSAFKRNRVGDS